MKKFKYHAIGSTLIVFAFLFSACNPGFVSERDVPAPKISEPKAPPERVIVDGIRTSYADIVQMASPAVVRITAVVKNNKPKRQSNSPLDEFFQQSPNNKRQNQRPSRGFGSGVIVSKDGTILTNHHVIKDATQITVETENNKSYEATVVGSDAPSDLAVIKIEGPEFSYLKLGDSDKVLVGDIVLAIGNPLGIGQTVTSGIISAKGRTTGFGDGSFEDFLQTDAPINRGNSGGALVNLSGELIGINSQILSPTGGNIGIGFSIPSNMANSIMEQLVKSGKVRRGRLGIGIQNISSDIAERLDLKNTNGVLVNDVQKGGAAEKAGLKRGDIITALNGENVEDGNSLRNKIAGTQPGTEIALKIVRDGKEKELKATLGEFEVAKSSKPAGTEDEGSKTPEAEDVVRQGKLGFSLEPLTPEIRKALNISEEIKGLFVKGVDAGSPAEEKGIRKGDVILEINRELVATLAEARSVLSKSEDKPVLLLISRRGQTVFISVKPAKN